MSIKCKKALVNNNRKSISSVSLSLSRYLSLLEVTWASKAKPNIGAFIDFCHGQSYTIQNQC